MRRESSRTARNGRTVTVCCGTRARRSSWDRRFNRRRCRDFQPVFRTGAAAGTAPRSRTDRKNLHAPLTGKYPPAGWSGIPAAFSLGKEKKPVGRSANENGRGGRRGAGQPRWEDRKEQSPTASVPPPPDRSYRWRRLNQRTARTLEPGFPGRSRMFESQPVGCASDKIISSGRDTCRYVKPKIFPRPGRPRFFSRGRRSSNGPGGADGQQIQPGAAEPAGPRRARLRQVKYWGVESTRAG